MDGHIKAISTPTLDNTKIVEFIRPLAFDVTWSKYRFHASESPVF
jgi:hypothetical protein